MRHQMRKVTASASLRPITCENDIDVTRSIISEGCNSANMKPVSMVAVKNDKEINEKMGEEQDSSQKESKNAIQLDIDDSAV